MPETISELAFDHTWEDVDFFPTYEGSEAKVRQDLQYHPDKIKKYINDVLVTVINSMLADISQLVAGTVTDDSVYTAAIQSGAVTLAKMAADSVDTTQIIDGAITILKMAADSVDTEQIVDGAVEYGKIAANAVRTNEINNGSVTSSKLGNDILPSKVGFIAGTGNPSTNPGLLANGQVYLRLES